MIPFRCYYLNDSIRLAGVFCFGRVLNFAEQAMLGWFWVYELYIRPIYISSIGINPQMTIAETVVTDPVKPV